MGTLAYCIKKLGLDENTVNYLQQKAAEYRDQGFNKAESERQAVQDGLDMIDAEYKSIVAQAEVQVREAIKAFESDPKQWYKWPFVRKNKLVLENKIREYRNALFDTPSFVESRFYEYDNPVPKSGGILAARDSKKYQTDKAYRKWVEDKIKQITGEILNANKSRMILLGKPSALYTGLGDFIIDRELAASLPEPYYAAGSEEASENVEATYGADMDRLWTLEAQNLYGQHNLGDIGIRETVQNSMDAVMEALDNKQIKSGKIEINTHRYMNDAAEPHADSADFQYHEGFEVIDNGIGMANDQVIRDKFLKIAGTGKSKPGRFGGFGVAKAVILKPMSGTIWQLESNNHYFNSQMAEQGRKVADLQTPRKGTKVWVRAPDWITSPEHIKFLETTVPPKKVKVLYNGKKLSSPFARKKGKKFKYKIFEDKTIDDPATGQSIDGSVTYDITYYGNPPEGYKNQAVYRLNDKKTGAKLTQGIGWLHSEFPGTLIVDITTNATPDHSWYPLTKSRQDLMHGKAREPITEVVGKFLIDKRSAGRDNAFTYYALTDRPEWKKTLQKVYAFDPPWEKFTKQMTQIRDDAIKAGLIEKDDLRPGGDLFVHPSKLSIKIDKGYKGYRGGSMLHAKMLAGYESLAMLLSDRLDAPVDEFYPLLSKMQADGGGVLAEYGGGQLGFNFIDVDKTSLKSPLGLAMYMFSQNVHELTHRFYHGHDENFSSAREHNERKSADIFPYALRIAEAILGKADTELTRIVTKDVPVEKIVTKTETIEKIVTNTVEVPVETIVEKEVPRILAMRQRKLEFDESKDTVSDEDLYYPVSPERPDRQRRLFGRELGGIDAGRIVSQPPARPGRGPQQPITQDVVEPGPRGVQPGPVTGKPATDEDLIIPEKPPKFYRMPDDKILYALQPQKWAQPPTKASKGIPGQWTFYKATTDQLRDRKKGTRVRGRNVRYWFDTEKQALEEMWKYAVKNRGIAVRPGFGGDFVEIAPVVQTAEDVELAFHNIPVGSVAEKILMGGIELSQIKPSQVSRGELEGLARFFGTQAKGEKQQTIDHLVKYQRNIEELMEYDVKDGVAKLIKAKNVTALKKMRSELGVWMQPGVRHKKADYATALMQYLVSNFGRISTDIEQFYNETGRPIPDYLKDGMDMHQQMYERIFGNSIGFTITDALAGFTGFERGEVVDYQWAMEHINRWSGLDDAVLDAETIKAIERGELYGVEVENVEALEDKEGLLKHGDKYYYAIGKMMPSLIDPKVMAKKLDSASMPDQLLEKLTEPQKYMDVGRQLGVMAIEYPTVKKSLMRASDALSDRISGANAEQDLDLQLRLANVASVLATAKDVVKAYNGQPSSMMAFVQDYKANPNAVRNQKILDQYFFDKLPQRESGPMEKYMATRAVKEAYIRRYLRPMGITVDDVKRLFHSENVVFKDGKIFVTTRGGHQLIVKSMDSIDVDNASFMVAYGRGVREGEMPTGRYKNGVIELHKDLSNNWTFTHETMHWMEDVGIITSKESDMLAEHIQKLYEQKRWDPANMNDIGGSEDRANYIALKIAERRRVGKLPGVEGWLNRLIQRIKDMLDGFVGMFKLTPQSLVRDIVTGKVYKRPKSGKRRMDLPQLMVTAYHGSPHFFKRFRTRFIGKGEGVQAFGWGLYFTDDKAIAKGYADRLGTDEWQDLAIKMRDETVSVIKNGEYEDYSPSKYEPAIKRTIKDPRKASATAVAKAALVEEIMVMENQLHQGYQQHGQVGVVAAMQDIVDDLIEMYQAEYNNAVQIARESVKAGEKADMWKKEMIGLQAKIDYLTKIRPDSVDAMVMKRKPSRAIYKVNLHEGKQPGDYDWLDWEQPVREDQIDKIIDQAVEENWDPFDIGDLEDALGRTPDYEGDPTDGLGIYDLIGDTILTQQPELVQLAGNARDTAKQRAASEFLLRAGIDGIRYPTGTLSGIKDSPKLNYVVFDENMVTIKEVERYHVQSPQEKEFIKQHPDKRGAEMVNQEMTNTALTFWQKVGRWFQKRKDVGIGEPIDTTVWDRLLFTPLHYFGKIPALKAMVEDGMNRSDNYYKKLHFIERTPENKSRIQMIDQLRKDNKKEYRRLSEELDKRDIDKYGWRVKAGEAPEESAEKVFNVINPDGEIVTTANDYDDGWRLAIQYEMAEFADKGYSEQALEALRSVREITHNGFNIMRQAINELITRYAQKEMPLPKVATWVDGERVQVDLKVALAQMGDMRGHYMPRIRRPGNYTLYAKDPKQIKPPILENFETNGLVPGVGAAWRAAQLEAEGYQTEIGRIKKMPEDVFQAAGQISAFQAIMNEALDKASGQMKKGAAAEMVDMLEKTQLEMGKALVQSVADVFKGRGVRQSMIMRNDAVGNQVWQGYETDLTQRTAKYAKSLAAGEAKKEMALTMLQHFTGTDVPWAEYKAMMAAGGLKATYAEYLEFVKNRRIDPIKQKNAYHDGLTYMQDMLRNDEGVDRLIGMVKGVAVLKYLAGRVAAPLVNLTALATSVPGAMSGYANIPLSKAPGLLAKGMNSWRQYIKKLNNPDLKMDQWLFDLYEEIEDRGWHQAQYNKEALSVLKSKIGNKYDSMLEVLMLGFGATEKLNRVATISGTYIGLMEANKSKWDAANPAQREKLHKQWLEAAKEVSDKAHGVYQKSNRPHYARGANLAARLAQTFYVFKTFSHNYLQTMYDLGFEKKDRKALLYMALSPAVIGGAAASPLIKLIFEAFALAGADEPEEAVYEWLEDNYGERVEQLARLGTFGLGGYGVSLKGSLEIGVTDIPTSLKDLVGAPGSMIYDLYLGGQSLARGDVLKALEKFSPNFIGSGIKAYREKTQGLTTGSNAPIFFGTEQVKLNWPESILRGLSFNPARIARIREKQWKETKLEQKFTKRRADIYAKIKAFYLQPRSKRTKEKWLELIQEAQEYNALVKRSGKPYPYITSKSIRNNLRRSLRPPKKERIRAANS